MRQISEKKFAIRELIKKDSPFCEKETERILKEFFNEVPSSVKILIERCDFDKKKVLDIGCGYGQSLFYWGKDSEGIEVQDRMVKFVESLNRTVYRLNVEEGISGLKKENYDAIYSNNLIEHLVSPHLFLARLHLLLKPGGILAIGHPVVPPFLFRSFWKLFGHCGWAAVEHINFFTPRTTKFMLERAGFKVKDQYFPGISRIHPVLGTLCSPIGTHILSVCQSIEGFKYDPKRLSKFNPFWATDLKKHYE